MTGKYFFSDLGTLPPFSVYHHTNEHDMYARTQQERRGGAITGGRGEKGKRLIIIVVVVIAYSGEKKVRCYC